MHGRNRTFVQKNEPHPVPNLLRLFMFSVTQWFCFGDTFFVYVVVPMHFYGFSPSILYFYKGKDFWDEDTQVINNEIN